MRYILSLTTALALLATIASAQETKKEEKPLEPECTNAYIKKLEEEYRHNKVIRGYSTDIIGAGCKAAGITEDLGAKAAEKTRLNKLWEKIPYSDRLNLRLSSEVCKYTRDLIDRQISTEEDGARLRNEIKRCTGAHVIN